MSETPNTPEQSEPIDAEFDAQYDILYPPRHGESQEEYKAKVVYLTKRLIQRASGANSEGCAVDEPCDTMVFLDKSARPVAWLVREFWSEFAAIDDEGSQAPMPEMKFVNIDQQQWIPEDARSITQSGLISWDGTLTPLGSSGANLDKSAKELINGIEDTKDTLDIAVAGLRGLFAAKVDETVFETSDDGEESVSLNKLKSLPSHLDDKKILVVDEVSFSGLTGRIAEKFFQEAFPTSEVSRATWMKGPRRIVNGEPRIPENPVWYSEAHSRGRGIGDRDPARAMESKNIRTKLGALMISAPLSAPGRQDGASLQLRREVANLAKEYRASSPDSLIRTYSAEDLKKQWWRH